MNRKFKKVVTLILIVSTLSQSALFLKPKSVQAQGITTGFSAGDIIGTSAQCLFPNGIGSAVSDLAKNIFTNSTAANAVKEATKDAAAQVAEKLGISVAATKASQAKDAVTAVPISDQTGVIQKTTGDVVEAVERATGPNAALTNISEKQNQEFKKTHCLDLIVHLITTKVIDKMTLATVNWINTGFNGLPLYLEDGVQFFGDIAKNEIYGVTGWFACNGAICDENYPFGKQIMQSILTNLQTGIQASMRFNLNQVLAHGDYTQFKEDFSVGGWAGYTAFLEPQNNPFGNYLLINQDLGHKVQGSSANKIQTFQNQLSLSGGFLNQRVCQQTASGSAYLGPDQGGENQADFYLDPNQYYLIPQGQSMTPDILASLPTLVQDEIDLQSDSLAQAAAYNNLVNSSTCIKWQTLTPGSVIADQLKTNLNLQTTKLINADSLGENIGLIFDALLNQLVQGGLNALNSGNANSVLVAQVNDQNPGGSGLTDDNGNPISIDGPSSPNVIIGGGVANDPSILDIQQSYVGLIVGAGGSPGALDSLNNLIIRIGALDYCVPGPNPNWISNAHEKLNTLTQAVSLSQQILPNIPLPTPTPVDPNDPSAAYNADQLANNTYYHNLIQALTGVNVNIDNSIGSAIQFDNFMNNMLTQYANRMSQDYSLNQAPPTERFFLAQYYNQLDDYQADFDSLTTYLQNIMPLMPTITTMYNVLNGSALANGGVVDETDPAVQTQLALFDSISSSLATQSQLDDLAQKVSFYTTQIGLLNTHIGSCLLEINNNYNYPNRRVAYPIDLSSILNLPPTNTSFLPTNVVFGSTPGSSNVIDIQTNGGGVTVNGYANDNFQLFRALLDIY
jgi:hypothetical protein